MTLEPHDIFKHIQKPKVYMPGELPHRLMYPDGLILWLDISAKITKIKQLTSLKEELLK